MNYTLFLFKWFEEHYEDGMLKDKYEWINWRLIDMGVELESFS